MPFSPFALDGSVGLLSLNAQTFQHHCYCSAVHAETFPPSTSAINSLVRRKFPFDRYVWPNKSNVLEVRPAGLNCHLTWQQNKHLSHFDGEAMVKLPLCFLQAANSVLVHSVCQPLGPVERTVMSISTEGNVMTVLI